MADEEALITSCIRLRLAAGDPGLTAAQTHAALTAEGVDVTLSQVKKACSKAGKRQVATATAPATAPPAAPAAVSKKDEKAQARATSAMKGAEAHMMDAQRKLRLAHGDDEYSAAVATSDRGERFIQMVTGKALEAKVEADEASFLKQRLVADLATLEWMLLAEAAGTLTLPADARTSATRQAERLKSARDADEEAMRACYIIKAAAPPGSTASDQPGDGIEYSRQNVLTRETTGAAIDRALARSGALAATSGDSAMDDVD